MEVKRTYLNASFAPEEIIGVMREWFSITDKIREAKRNLNNAVDDGLKTGLVPPCELKVLVFDQFLMEKVREMEKAIHDAVALAKEQNMKGNIEILLESEQAGGKYASLFEKFDPRKLR